MLFITCFGESFRELSRLDASQGVEFFALMFQLTHHILFQVIEGNFKMLDIFFPLSELSVCVRHLFPQLILKLMLLFKIAF